MGKRCEKSYHTKGHEIDFHSSKESVQSFFDTSPGNVTHETLKKMKTKRKMSMQKMCPVLKIRREIPFGFYAQEKPANARVLWPVSMSSTGGCIKDM